MSSGSPVPPLRRCTFPLATSTKLSVHACVTVLSPVFAALRTCSNSPKSKVQGPKCGRFRIPQLSDEPFFLSRCLQSIESLCRAGHERCAAFEIKDLFMGRVCIIHRGKGCGNPLRQ